MRWMTALFMVLGAALSLGAQARPGFDVNKMVPDIMRMEMGQGKECIAMWCPTRFFVAAGLSQTPSADPTDMERELAILDDFTMFAVQAKAKGDDGEVSLDAEQLRAAAVLLDAKGREVRPLREFPPKVQIMLDAMRTGMASNGANEMRVLVFPAKDMDGTRLGSPTQRGMVTLKVRAAHGFPGVTFTWRTPLTSFASPSTCGKCKETLQAAWAFCPFCGEPARSR